MWMSCTCLCDNKVPFSEKLREGWPHPRVRDRWTRVIRKIGSEGWDMDPHSYMFIYFQAQGKLREEVLHAYTRKQGILDLSMFWMKLQNQSEFTKYVIAVAPEAHLDCSVNWNIIRKVARVEVAF